jgi:hypothetical protein
MLYGWTFVTLGLFLALPPRRALLFSVIGGMILLPAHAMYVPILPGRFDRAAAVILPCLLGVLLTDSGVFRRFRVVATDWAMLGLLLAPFFASLSNGLGLYDGLSNIYRHAMIFGFPYLLGRLYFRDSEGVKAMVVAIAIAGILLAPLALFEIRMSPQLHSMVYGKSAVRFFMFARFSGYRPIAFFPSPLMLTFAISAGTLCAFWLSQSFRGSRFYQVPYLYWALLLAVTTILGKTLGAITLMIVGSGLLWFTGRTGRRFILLATVSFVLLYPALRVTQILKAEPIIAVIEPIYPESNVSTLSYRLTQEDLFSQHALERPFFGWGGWGRNRTRETRSIDGLWIILFSTQGFFGIFSYMSVFGIPILRGLRTGGRRRITDPSIGPPVVLAVVLFILWVDCLSNAFLGPLFMMAVGCLAGFRHTPAQAAPKHPPDEPEPDPGTTPTSPRFIDLKRRQSLGARGGL